MKKFIRVMAAVALALTLTLAGSAVLPAQAAGVLFAFGDSVAAGEGSGPGTGFPDNEGSFNEVFAARHGYAVHNFAVTGATTTHVREAQLPLALGRGIQPSLITLMAGANDIGYGQCLLSMIGASQVNPCTPAGLASSLPAMGASLAETLVALKTAFPQARIAVLSYYNPMPKRRAACRAMKPLLEAKLLFADQNVPGFVQSVTDRSKADVKAFQGELHGAAQAVVNGLNAAVRGAVAAARRVVGSRVASVIGLNFTNHDFCRDYYRKNQAWVLAPKILSQGAVTLPSGQLPVGTTASPKHWCRDGVLCPAQPAAPDVYLAVPANPYGVSYEIAVWVNDFPHLTVAGNRAVARTLAHVLNS